MAMASNGQNCPTKARTRKLWVLCNTPWNWITNQQCFDCIDFLTANTLSCCWHWLAMNTLALDSKRFQTCKTISFVFICTKLHYRDSLRQNDYPWPGLASLRLCWRFLTLTLSSRLDIPHWHHRWQQYLGY